MKLSREDFIARISARIGEDNSDEALAFMEDMTDTYDDLFSKTTDTEDWKKKYEENDKAWRDKYKERFTSSSIEDNNDGEDENEKPTPMTFEELFTTEEK